MDPRTKDKVDKEDYDLTGLEEVTTETGDTEAESGVDGEQGNGPQDDEAECEAD